MTVLDDILNAPDGKERARIKAEAIRDVLQTAYDAGSVVDGVWSFTRQVGAQTWTLKMDRRPQLVRDRDGRVIGFQIWIRLFRGLTEVHIDPHRMFINPPIQIEDGTTHTEVGPNGETYQVANWKVDILESAMRMLIQQIRDNPAPEGWIP